MSSAPACHRGAGWTSSRIGRRFPWAAPCSPWCSCTSWPSLDESSSPTRKSSWARSGVLVHTTSFCPYPSFFVVFSLLQLNSTVLVQVTSLIVFFLHVAIRSLHVAALVVILGGGVNVVSGVAHPVLPCKAPLDLVSLLKRLVMDSLHEVTYQLVHIEADTLDIGLNDPGAVFEQFRLASLLVLCPASLLSVWLALVLEDDLLHLVAVGVLVDAVAPNIGLANVWIIILNWRWCWVLRWGGWWR